MRFGARATLHARASSPWRRGCCCSPARPVEATTSLTCVPPVVLIGLGAGLSFPSLMTLAMSGVRAERLGAGLRPGQRDRAGGRRDRSGRACHAGRRPHRRPAGRRRVGGVRAQLGLPPGLPGRRRARCRRADRGADRASLGLAAGGSRRGRTRRARARSPRSPKRPDGRPRRAACPRPSSGGRALARHAIAGIGELAAVERQAAAADALGQAGAQPLELGDALVDARRPRAESPAQSERRGTRFSGSFASSRATSSSVRPMRWANTTKATRRMTGRDSGGDRPRCARSGSGRAPRRTEGRTWPPRCAVPPPRSSASSAT